MILTLVDTNIWLERLLDQERAGEVGRFLTAVSPDQLAISDFSYHSIALIMARLGRYDSFLEFSADLLAPGAVSLIRVSPDNMRTIGTAISKYRLDFDDAYQYALAVQYGKRIISLDADFDRTDLKRLQPLQALQDADDRHHGVSETPAMYRVSGKKKSSKKRRRGSGS